MLQRLRDIMARRQVLGILVKRDLRVRYARSILGYLWTILDPLAMALIYFMIFVVIFKREDAGHQPYFLFLIIGLLAWQWFNASVNETGRALLAEQKLVRSTSLPRELWVVRVVIAKGIEFLLSLPILVAFTAWFVATGEAHLNLRILYFLPALVLQFVFQVGLGLILAPLTVLVDDTTRVVRIVLRMGFYMTPIVFVITKAPAWLKEALRVNPLTGMLELYRAGFFPEPLDHLSVYIACASSVLTLVVGMVVFARLERAVLKEI